MVVRDDAYYTGLGLHIARRLKEFDVLEEEKQLLELRDKAKVQIEKIKVMVEEAKKKSDQHKKLERLRGGLDYMKRHRHDGDGSDNNGEPIFTGLGSDRVHVTIDNNDMDG